MKNKESKARHISVWTASAFVISSMIGTGVFTSLGFQLVDIQSIFPLLMLWVIGGVIALFGAISYSELAAALPRSGGEYHLLSRVIHPALDPTMVAFFVIIFFTLLHSFSIKYGTIIQDTTTAIKIGLIIIFIIAGFSISDPQQINIFPIAGDMSLILSSGFAVSLVWVSYAYTGWNSTVYIAGEVKNPQKNIHKSLLISTGFVMILYVLLNFIFLYSTPISQMIGEVEVGYISGMKIFGSMGANIIGIGIAILLLSTVSSYIFIGPRITQVMGEDHSFLKFLAIKNNNDIPINGFILQFIISMLFIYSSSFEQVLLYAGITFIISTTATVVGVFILRKREPNLNRPYKAWGHPWTSGIFILLNIWILFYTFLEQPLESIIGLSIVLTSLGIYFFGRKF